MTDNQFSTQDKIKYLKRYVLLDQEINRKFLEVERWRLRLGKITATITDMPQGGGSIHASTDHDIINRIVDLENSMNQEIDQLIDLKQEITKIINDVQDDQARMLLQFRYLDGLTFEQVSVNISYCWKQTHRLHSRALGMINLPCRRAAVEQANIG